MSRTETLKPLTAEPVAGDEVKISRNVLRELYQRLSDAIAAVEVLNNRITGNNRLWACTDSIFRTGKAPADCPRSN